MPISQEDASVVPTGPYLPETPPAPWLPVPPAGVADPVPAPSLWDVRTTSGPRANRAAPRRRGGRRPFVAVLVLGVVGAAGYLTFSKFIASDSDEAATLVADVAASTPVSVVATSTLTDSTILPDTVFVRPSYRVASYVETSRHVGYDEGLPFEQDIVITAEVDYVTPVSSFVFDFGDAVDKTSMLIWTNEHSYTTDIPVVGPWERKPREPSTKALDTLEYLKMYQEVVTPAVRENATAVSETNGVVHGIPVTTYQFNVPLTALPQFVAATADGPIDALMKAELLEVHVTLSMDADGLLRLTDYQFNERAWIDAAAASPDGYDWFVHSRTEVTSTSNEPSLVVPPAEFVDVPAG